MENLDPQIFPNLSRIQDKNPEYLEEMLMPMAKKNNITLEQAAAVLESDLMTEASYVPESEGE